jgi:hypothetical protein
MKERTDTDTHTCNLMIKFRALRLQFKILLAVVRLLNLKEILDLAVLVLTQV